MHRTGAGICLPTLGREKPMKRRAAAVAHFQWLRPCVERMFSGLLPTEPLSVALLDGNAKRITYRKPKIYPYSLEGSLTV